jgi:hypothetical protein
MEQIVIDVERVPRLYRDVLDLASILSQMDGCRPRATRARNAAIRAYSRGWSAAQEHQLLRLRSELAEKLASISPRE